MLNKEYNQWLFDLFKEKPQNIKINETISFIKDKNKKDPVLDNDKRFLNKNEKQNIEGVSANDWNNEYEWSKEDNRAHKRMKKVIKYIPKEGIHLDIGVGRGDGTFLVSKIKKTVGIEYGTLVAELARKKYNNIIQCNASSLPFKDNSFKSITMLDSLEHILSPENALKECKRVLIDGGTLIISTPTKEDFKIKRIGIFIYKFFRIKTKIVKIIRVFKKEKKQLKKSPQPIEIPRPRKTVKKLISKYFFIENHKYLNYWNKSKIVQLFSFSDLFICKKK